jgi:hypothetical protein
MQVLFRPRLSEPEHRLGQDASLFHMGLTHVMGSWSLRSSEGMSQASKHQLKLNYVGIEELTQMSRISPCHYPGVWFISQQVKLALRSIEMAWLGAGC